MKHLFLILLLTVIITGCGESMKEKEEKAERLRQESQALLAGLTKNNAEESKHAASSEDTSSKEPENQEVSPAKAPEKEEPTQAQPETPSDAPESEENDPWKNPYANYSDYKESPLNTAIKKRYEELFSDREKNPNYNASATQEQIRQYEQQCDRIVAEEFGITPKEASDIYVKSVLAATTNSKAQYDIFEYLKKYFSEETLPIAVSAIEINRDPNKAEEAYIVLIYADYVQKNRSEFANSAMSIVAQNIAIHLQLMENVDFSDLVFFFRDNYNQRDLKLTAEWDANFRGFFRTGIWY